MKFVFVVHPLSLGDITRRYPRLKRWPRGLVESLMLFKSPKQIGKTGLIYSDHNGNRIEGIFVGVPLLPSMFKRLPTWLLNLRVGQAIEHGHRLGAKVAGLGALTACYGDAGVTLNEEAHIPVTTGNTYTVATVVEAAKELTERFYGHIPPERRVLGIAGASGSIGQTCLELLKPLFGRIILLSRTEEAGMRVVREFCLDDTHESMVVTNAYSFRRAHVVVSVTSSETAVIHSDDISSGTLVIDVARPRDVSASLADRTGVLVIEGGVVAVPGLPDLGLDFGFPPGHCYACMAETMLDALEGIEEGLCEASTVGRVINVEDVTRQEERARKHGFKLAGYRSFDRPVTEEMLEEFSRFAADRNHIGSYAE